MFVGLNGGFQTLAPCENFLRVLLIFPELRLRYLLLKNFKFATLPGCVKENLATPGLCASARQILLSVLQSQSILSAGLDLNTAFLRATRIYAKHQEHHARYSNA